MHLLTIAAVLIIAISGIAGKCPTTTYRSGWGARKPKNIVKMDAKPNKIIIKDTGHTYRSCRTGIKGLQNQDMRNSDDINCNFVFGFSGNVCEGRGWYSAVDNTKTLVFCVMGNFHHQKVHPKLSQALSDFLNCPDTQVILDPSYTITTPRDQSELVENPGHYLYNVVRKMPHFKAGPFTRGINTTDTVLDCPDLIERHDWNAEQAMGVTPYPGKPNKVLVKETGHRYDSCTSVIKAIQRTDMTKHNSTDIDCNFVFGFAGDMCEGRGWRNTVLGNDLLVICVTDNFHNNRVKPDLKTSLNEFFNCTLTDKLIDPNYEIITLRDTVPQSLNPGNNLYNFVKTLPHYKKSAEKPDYNSLWKEEESVWTIGK